MIGSVLNSKTVRSALASAPRGSSRVGRLISRHYPRAQVFELVGSLAPMSMYLDTNDPFQSEMACGTYQRSLIRKILQLARPGDVVITAGAHLGYVALALAKAVGPAGRVLAFEPDPRMVQRCDENLKLNALDKIVNLNPIGLGSSDAQLQMSISSTAGQSSLAIAHHHLEYTTVPVRKGDDVIQEMGVTKVDGLVLDVEGWELHVLDGLTETLTTCRPRWAIVECWDVALKGAGSSADELMAKLRVLGWDLRTVDGAAPGDGHDLICTRRNELA